MKALEILKILAEDYEYNIDDNSKVLEAIAELEALQDELQELRFKCTMLQSENDKLNIWFGSQESKNCYGCFWLDTKNKSMTQAYCTKCIRNDFMQDRYEPKGQP